jgi:hypothetical protein
MITPTTSPCSHGLVLDFVRCLICSWYEWKHVQCVTAIPYLFSLDWRTCTRGFLHFQPGIPMLMFMFILDELLESEFGDHELVA